MNSGKGWICVLIPPPRFSILGGCCEFCGSAESNNHSSDGAPRQGGCECTCVCVCVCVFVCALVKACTCVGWLKHAYSFHETTKQKSLENYLLLL